MLESELRFVPLLELEKMVSTADQSLIFFVFQQSKNIMKVEKYQLVNTQIIDRKLDEFLIQLY